MPPLSLDAIGAFPPPLAPSRTIPAPPLPADSPLPRAERRAVAAVLAGAALLRAWGLSRFPLEQDELYTVMEGRELWSVPLAPGIYARPLYFLLQNVLLRVLPQTETWLRVVPFLFGVAGVWAVWALARRIFGPAAGLSAAVLVALSPWHLHASGFARYWSLLFLLGALFYRGLWEAYGRGRPRDFTLALLPLLLGSATHPSFLFPVAGAALGVSLVRADGSAGWRWPSRLAWTRLWGPYLVFVGAAWAALRLTGHGGALQNWTGRGWAASLRLVPAVVEWISPAVAVAGLLGAGAALLSADAGRRRWGAMTACGGTVALATLFALSVRTDVYADYATAMLPLVFVSAGGLVGMAVERMGSARVPAAAGAVAVLCAAVLPATLSHLAGGTRFDYRPAFAWLRGHAPGETVLTWPGIVGTHYAPDLHTRGLRMDTAFLDRTLAAGRPVWVVASMQRFGMVSDDGTVTAWLAHRCTQEAAFEAPRWDYRVYRVVLHRCAPSPASGATAR